MILAVALLATTAATIATNHPSPFVQQPPKSFWHFKTITRTVDLGSFKDGFAEFYNEFRNKNQNEFTFNASLKNGTIVVTWEREPVKFSYKILTQYTYPLAVNATVLTSDFVDYIRRFEEANPNGYFIGSLKKNESIYAEIKSIGFEFEFILNSDKHGVDFVWANVTNCSN
ncbi:unnamed protein product [Caenorhabditis bovis]|uniref:Uncharacterized protein n=1 Tax=Caenorhabditis bovis TaxID=2654633 RepID=A0A8S1EVA1_9PELO|nr:unnamed protein product [Caenorhabditis bovis]